MKLDEFLHRREGWEKLAPPAAASLRRQDPEPALGLLDAWRFTSDRKASAALLRQLCAAPLCPDPRAGRMSMGALVLEGPPTAAAWREAAWELEAPAPPVEDPLAWALVELATVGALYDDDMRQAWGRVAYRDDPALDRKVAAMWSDWCHRRFWDLRGPWERLLLGTVIRAFSAVLYDRRVPPELRARAASDAREGFYFALIGGGEGSESWRELAVRVLETAGGGPIDALARALPVEGNSWEIVARCAITRGYGPETAELAWEEGGDWLWRSRELARRGRQQSTRLEELLDLHLAARLVARWQQPACTAPDRTWNVIRHNHGRARARLRAVLRGAPGELLEQQLLALPGLAARTRNAAARFGREWAWQCLQHALTFDDDRTLDPACCLPDGGPQPYSPDQRAQLRAWVLMVILSDRFEHLHAWAMQRGFGSLNPGDTTWGRLLADDCPAGLRPAGKGEGKHQDLQRLRAELIEHLPALLQEMAPALRAIAARPFVSGKAPERYDPFLASLLHPLVRVPQYRTRVVEAARAILARLDFAVTADLEES